MKFYLLVFLIVLVQAASGQAPANDLVQVYSAKNLEAAQKSLSAVSKSYKIIYRPALQLVLPPVQEVKDATPAQLVDGDIAANQNYLQDALSKQVEENLKKANAEFEALPDKEKTILILDNIVVTSGQKAPANEGKAVIQHLSKRQFIFGKGITAAVENAIAGCTPVSVLNFNDLSLGENDKYLNEYITLLTAAAEKTPNTEAHIDYPWGSPVIIMIVEGTGYLHIDPSLVLKQAEMDALKKSIMANIKGLYDLLPAPENYVVKDDNFQFNTAVISYAFKRNKDAEMEAVFLNDASRTWTLNGDPMPTVSAQDSRFIFTAFNETADGKEIYKLRDGDNIMKISSDIGKAYVAKAYSTKDPATLTKSFDIKFAYNSSKLFLKASIRGQQPVRIDFGKVIGEENGKATLEIGDVVELYLFRTVSGEEKLVTTSLWSADGEKYVNAEHATVTIKNGVNDIAVKVAEGENVNTIKFAYNRPQQKEIEFSFANVDLSKLPASDRSTAKYYFEDALKKIDEKNKDLSRYFISNNARIQSYILPGNDPLLARPSSDAKKVLMGFADKQIALNYKSDYLDVINIKTNKRGIIEDATLVVRLYGNDRQSLLNAAVDKSPAIQDAANLILDRLRNTDQKMSGRIRKLIEAGTLKDADLNDCYELIPDDAGVITSYCKIINSKKLLYLNYNGILLMDATHPVTMEHRFTSITAHEMVHLYYTAQHYHSVLKWHVIRSKQSKYGYKFGTSRCSQDDGHEVNNPEDTATCDEQTKYIPQTQGTPVP
ncbi:hypothetical protein [Chitinophaga rhizophila]|uniref:Uncharacterized protein n=1 Tax=Chitinophaga rhizophila TaxID=2866212 RepID=A0ABS7GKX9_9BACT|nr:hypothetical protein [Chitinophaga rhizophila]MBW8688368.1 hypothetical protein [Chitinophaga rhizophila]